MTTWWPFYYCPFPILYSFKSKGSLYIRFQAQEHSAAVPLSLENYKEQNERRLPSLSWILEFQIHESLDFLDHRLSLKRSQGKSFGAIV